MATFTIVQFVDDLDGSTTDVATHRFTVDGVTYEIDLSAPNTARLRDAFAPYIAAGRRRPKTASRTTRTRRTTAHGATSTPAA
jgi:hypothetical protein